MRILLAVLATLACASATLAAFPKDETEFRTRFAYVDKDGKLLGIGGSSEISPGKRVTPDALDGWIRKLGGT
jgi:hypothetical protein